MLARSLGYQLTRVPGSGKNPAAGRRHPHKRVNILVPQPTFLLSSVRSGSTLLRVILDSHSQICAPHELHLRTFQVKISTGFGRVSAKELGLGQRRMEHLLWDRILERELSASGKQIIVDKTPNNVFIWERLPQAWPQARFIFLLRHPAAIADSLKRATKNGVMETAVKRVKQYADALEAARTNLPGLTVKYEELLEDPEAVTKAICKFLRIDWEASMLDYGSQQHGKYAKLLGDWSPKIRSGEIHSDYVLPADEDIPELLRDVSRQWGYLR